MTTGTDQAQHQVVINGEWCNGSAGTFPDLNPATGEVWAHTADAGREDATGIAHINCSSINDEPVVPADAFPVIRWITPERGARHFPF